MTPIGKMKIINQFQRQNTFKINTKAESIDDDFVFPTYNDACPKLSNQIKSLKTNYLPGAVKYHKIIKNKPKTHPIKSILLCNIIPYIISLAKQKQIDYVNLYSH